MKADDLNISDQWRAWRARVDLEEYGTRFDRRAATGENVHGEADFVTDLVAPGRALDAGCGTGRVAIELANRGFTTVGVDNDADMLAVARTRAPALTWILSDLASASVEVPFDVVVMAGNVLQFVTDGFEADVVANLADHLRSDGLLIAGASVLDERHVGRYDRWCLEAGLTPVARHASWDGTAYDPAASYFVSVHRRVDGERPRS